MMDKSEAYESLIEKGWSEWWVLDENVARKIPEFPGVYEIGATGDFGRLKGAARTLYIGSSNDKNGLLNRLGNLIRLGGTHVARKRLDRIQQEFGDTIWIRTKVTMGDEAKEMEKSLLRQYEQEHLELPPCNHRL